jgi:opacity protein-like surface antigen
MNKLLAAVALAAVISTPALAQYGGQSVDQLPRTYQYGQPTNGTAQYGQRDVRRHSPNPAYDVYDTEGHYVGSDPDPRVRDELRLDHNGRGY